MRADLERAIARRRAKESGDPAEMVAGLRRVVEMAEAGNDWNAFSAAIWEYEQAVRANPAAESDPVGVIS